MHSYTLYKSLSYKHALPSWIMYYVNLISEVLWDRLTRYHPFDPLYSDPVYNINND
jgi:hypothetical protein